MSQENISPQEFGALQADVKNLAREIGLLRKLKIERLLG